MSLFLVSVVIPTYNRGLAIRATVQSVLEQDLPPEQIEILIIDDGSSDNTWDILSKLYDHHPQIRLFRIANGGVARARNFGLEQARGEFIAYLDHDDIWLPQKLRLQCEMLRNHPHCGVVYCRWLSVNEALQPLPDAEQIIAQHWWKPRQGWVYPWIYCPSLQTYPRNPIISMSFPLVRTALVRSVGGFDPTTVPSDDWDLWIQLSHVTQFAYLDKVLVFYVHHAGQQHGDLDKAHESWLSILGKYRINFWRNPQRWVICRAFGDYIHHFEEYVDSKENLFAKRYFQAWKIVIFVILKKPLVIFSRQYGYLIYRMIRFKSERY